MIGRFLEWSIATTDIRASVDYYTALGFASADVGEAWPHPYAVLTDGRINLGLHQADFAPSATFVRPGLLGFLDDIEAMGISPEFRHLASGVFNEIGWLDPSGQRVRVVEARTFSPLKRLAGEESLCGYFLEIALPASAGDSSKAHWERCGFVGLDEPLALLPHVSCTSDTIDIGLYDPAHLREPTLLFEVPDLAATLRRLEDVGVKPEGRRPSALATQRVATLRAPEGTAILIAERSAW